MKIKRQRFSCSHFDGSDTERILAIDHLEAAEIYYRKYLEDSQYDAKDYENTIGDVKVVSKNRNAVIVTVTSQRILDVHAVKTRSCR